MDNVNEETHSTRNIVINRHPLTIEERHQQYNYEQPQPVDIKKKLKSNLKETFTCTKQKWIHFLYGKLPILEWLIGYDVKNWLVGDLVAGITVAIMHIPQGMGFALLAHVPAIVGIYMAFYQSLIYAIFATSRHNSMGTFAVITLMTGKVVKQLATFPSEVPPLVGAAFLNSTDVPTTIAAGLVDVDLQDVVTYTPIQIATVVCFMVGVWHMIFGILQLGSLAVFLSEMLVSGFTTAAAVHVLTSQMKDLLGITIQGFSGPFKIIYTYIEIFKALPTINIATLVVTIIAITVLVVNNEVLKPIVAKYSKIPVPIELIAVAVGTGGSYLASATDTYDVQIIGNVPTGLPPPTIPPLELLGKVAVDSLVIAIVAYTVNFSLAKIFAAKHGYPVDATQELYANGLSNLFSSFFSCAPMASALARTLIQDSVGGVTQMASLIVCAIIVLVLLFIGPVFETLPKAVLASIIVVALKGMFIQVKDMVNMWKISRTDAITWLITFFSVVVIDIDFGLLIGILFSLFVLLSKNQKPATYKLGRVPNTDLYLDITRYPQAKEISGIKLFRIVGALHFANRENFKSLLVKGTGLDPKIIAKSLENKMNGDSAVKNVMMISMENGNSKCEDNTDPSEIRYLILDVSGMSYIDSSGGKFLEQLRIEYEKANIALCIAGLSDRVLEVISKTGCLKTFPADHLFHSVHDAVVLLNF